MIFIVIVLVHYCFRCDKDNLEGTLRKILVLKELTQREHKGQGLYCSFKMLHGDIKQVNLCECVCALTFVYIDWKALYKSVGIEYLII